MVTSKLEGFLKEIANGHFARAVLVAYDDTEGAVHSVATYGLSPLQRKIELSAKGTISPQNPAAVFNYLDTDTLVTCIDPNFLRSEYSQNDGDIRQRFYAAQLAGVDAGRRRTYARHVRKGKIDGSVVDVNQYLSSHSQTSDISLECPGVVDSDLLCRPDDVSMNSFSIAVKLDGRLVGALMFDTPIGVTDYTFPVSLDFQDGVRQKLEEYLPALLRAEARGLVSTNPEFAERMYGMLMGAGETYFTQAGEPSANRVGFPCPLFSQSDGPVEVIKSFKRVGSAEVESATRIAAAANGVGVFPPLWVTENYLGSEFVPNMSLADITRFGQLPMRVKLGLIGILRASINKLNGMDWSSIALDPSVDHAAKLAAAFLSLNPGLDPEETRILSKRLTGNMVATVRRQDRSLRNNSIPLSVLGKKYVLPSGLMADLSKAPGTGRYGQVITLCQALSPYIIADEDKFLTFVGDSLLVGDTETFRRETFASDDYIELMGSPAFGFDVETRMAIMAEIDPREVLYRSTRWLYWIRKLVQQKRSPERIKELKRDSNYFLETAIAAAKKIGEPTLEEILSFS
jgi:hypothetical protein